MTRSRHGRLRSLVPALLAPVGLAFCAAAFAPLSGLAAQDGEAAPRPLTVDDYAKWNRIVGTKLSPDGRFLTYGFRPNEGDTRFFVTLTNRPQGQETFAGVLREVAQAGDAVFSSDSRFLAYRVRKTEAEQKKLRKQKKDVTAAVEVLDLNGGKTRRIENVQSFRFAEEGPILAVQKNRADKKAEHDGADLLLLDLRDEELETAAITNLGNVSSYRFDELSNWLAYTVDAADQAGNGLYLFDLDQKRSTALDAGAYSYRGLAFDEDGRSLAVLRGRSVEGAKQDTNHLLVFSGLGADPQRWVLDPEADDRFPMGYTLSEKRSPSFSDDGRRVFVGAVPWETEDEDESDEKSKDDSDEEADVEVWHWKDERVQSVQKVQASRDANRTWLGVAHLFDEAGEPLSKPRYTQLADEDLRSVSVSDHPRIAIARDDSEYRGRMDIDRGLADYDTIDLWTGERRGIVRSVRRSMGSSPDGRFFVWSEQGQVFVQDVEKGERIELADLTDVDFVNREADRPSEKGTYGVAGWGDEGRTLLLNQRFDIHAIPLAANPSDDSDVAPAYSLTRGLGAKTQTRFRLFDLDPDSDFVDLKNDVLVTAYGERTKQSGYFKIEAGKSPSALIFEDAMVGPLTKAEHADLFIYTKQTAVDFPDLYLSGPSLAYPTRLTDANPQQAEFAWTPGRVLIDYTDRRGNELQATVTLPAGYVRGKQYPTLVYFYEKMSQRHHQYSMPSFDDRPHMSTYASHGYVVIQPDVVYTKGEPGSSALDDVTAAVQKAIDLGYVDPERVGLQGHSWGGYQSSFLVTQTDLFACVVTGAPLTNLVSMHNVLYKRSGSPNAGLIQWGQGRMGVSPWDDWQAYLDESPIYHAEKISTPFLILHGTADGAVDWNQGLEFYIAAKRLGKEVILLSYPGEPHHLRKKANQIDFQHRMKAYFDHYLKGEPAPQWMTDGVDWRDR